MRMYDDIHIFTQSHPSTCHSKNREHSKGAQIVWYVSWGPAGYNQLTLTFLVHFHHSTSYVWFQEDSFQKENVNYKVSRSCTNFDKWKEDQCRAEAAADKSIASFKTECRQWSTASLWSRTTNTACFQLLSDNRCDLRETSYLTSNLVFYDTWRSLKNHCTHLFKFCNTNIWVFNKSYQITQKT